MIGNLLMISFNYTDGPQVLLHSFPDDGVSDRTLVTAGPYSSIFYFGVNGCIIFFLKCQ